MTISEEKKCVTIFVISDSAGETASKLAAASMAQYPTVDFTLLINFSMSINCSILTF